MMPTLTWVWLIACEAPSDGPKGADPTGGTDTGVDTTDPDPPEPVEACNGLDDDLDGEIDEGLDEDGDGVPDCVRPLGIEAELFTPDEGGVMGPPAIGLFVDDNGDGALGPGDLPVLVIDYNGSEWLGTRVLRADGSVVLAIEDDLAEGSGAVLDVDGDGWTEVVGLVLSGNRMRARAWRNDGSLLWESPLLPPSDTAVTGDYNPSAGDIDGDGTLELVFRRYVVSGVDGAFRFWLHPSEQRRWWIAPPTLADLDGDGASEILYNDCVFGADPEPRWCAGFGGTALYEVEAFGAAVDVDPAPGLEVLMANRGAISVFTGDGAPLDTWTVGGETASQPCVADFDGDGGLEIGFATDIATTVLRLDGTPLWSVPSEPDQYGERGSCSGADLDGDGAAELLYTRKGPGFVVHDGATGAVEFSDDNIGHPAFWGVPAVVDFDADGFAEIVIGMGHDSYGQPGRMVVYGGPAWIGVGPQWGLNDFAEARLSAGGQVLPGDGGLRLARDVRMP